ncbi:hypothetical protein ACPAY5_06195 [Staphylococcus caledonicus]|uniref:hypothetical protein n=1 Tax=Staphylococcus caledonicus TaxID=2741333 RepID=UPI003C2B2668
MAQLQLVQLFRLAETNAALAWLGGGAIAAGGGGTVAGSALLALSGPIGWTIGGISIATAGLLTSSKNKKVANEARTKQVEVKTQIKMLKGTSEEVIETTELTKTTNLLIDPFYDDVLNRTTKYKSIAINQVIQNFGLEKIMKVYKAGGNVTTLNNFKNGVFSDEETQSKYNQIQANKIKLDRDSLDRNVTRINKDGEKEVLSFSLTNISKKTGKIFNGEKELANDKTKIKNPPSKTEKNQSNARVSDRGKNQINGIANKHKHSDGKIRDAYNKKIFLILRNLINQTINMII